MTALLSSLVGLLFVFLVFIPADLAVAQAPPVDLRTFVTAPHPHGLPYASVAVAPPLVAPGTAVPRSINPPRKYKFIRGWTPGTKGE